MSSKSGVMLIFDIRNTFLYSRIHWASSNDCRYISCRNGNALLYCAENSDIKLLINVTVGTINECIHLCKRPSDAVDVRSPIPV